MSKPRRPAAKKPHRKSAPGGHLPETCVVQVNGVTDDGELLATPVSWDPKRKPPHIVITESGRQKAAVVGDKLLVKLRKVSPHLYQGLVIRLLPTDAPRNIIGMLVMTAEGGIIEPISRKL